MKTPRRKPIEPDAKFARMLLKAQKLGQKLQTDEITIIPPNEKNKYWTLRASFRNMPRERSAKNTLGDVNAAYLDLSSELQSLRNGAEGMPENSHHQLSEVIKGYIDQGGPKNEWRGKTPKNRTEDFAHLIKLSEKNSYTCEELNASVIRSYLTSATNSSKRAKGLLVTIRTFIKWGIGTGYFTTAQLETVSRVVWRAPEGSNYKAAPSRREQSKLHFGTDDSAGGQVPTHEQVSAIATELQKHYKFGEALVHVLANMGTRANETLIFTASRKVFEAKRGNYVDLQEEAVRVHWQYEKKPGVRTEPVTKNNKFRSVVIPAVEKIETGFDVLGWLKQRSKEALEEQIAGTNPLALIFPNTSGQVINLNSFSSEKMRPTLSALGMKMPPYLDAAGKARYMYRFTIHSFRDRYGTTAADEWGYSERQLLEQGSWADAETVRKFYLGTTDATYQTVRDLHNKGSKASNRRKAS
jgi:integrase